MGKKIIVFSIFLISFFLLHAQAAKETQAEKWNSLSMDSKRGLIIGYAYSATNVLSIAGPLLEVKETLDEDGVFVLNLFYIAFKMKDDERTVFNIIAMIDEYYKKEGNSNHHLSDVLHEVVIGKPIEQFRFKNR